MNSEINIIACDLAIRNTGLVWGKAMLVNDVLKFGKLHHEEYNTQQPLKGMDAYDRMAMEASSAMDIANRINDIASDMEEAGDWPCIAIEVPYTSQSSRSAILLGLCWMVAEILSRRDDRYVCRIHPLLLKEHITGHRQADKNVVKSEMITRFATLMNEPSDHIIDAYATMITFLETPYLSAKIWRDQKTS